MGPICDKSRYDEVYLEIRRNEVSDGIHQASGSLVNTSVEPTALDILPAGKSYDAAVGRSGNIGKTRWTVLAEEDEPPDYVDSEEEPHNEGEKTDNPPYARRA